MIVHSRSNACTFDDMKEIIIMEFFSSKESSSLFNVEYGMHQQHISHLHIQKFMLLSLNFYVANTKLLTERDHNVVCNEDQYDGI